MPFKIFTELTPLRVISATSESPETWPSGAKENILRLRQPSLRWRPAGGASASITVQTVSGLTLPTAAYFTVYDTINISTITVELSSNQSTWTTVASGVSIPTDPRDSKQKLFYGWLLGSDPGSYARITVPAATNLAPAGIGCFAVMSLSRMVDVRLGTFRHVRQRGVVSVMTPGGVEWSAQASLPVIISEIDMLCPYKLGTTVMEQLLRTAPGDPIVIALDRTDQDTFWRSEVYLGTMISTPKFTERASMMQIRFTFMEF